MPLTKSNLKYNIIKINGTKINKDFIIVGNIKETIDEDIIGNACQTSSK